MREEDPGFCLNHGWMGEEADLLCLTGHFDAGEALGEYRVWFLLENFFSVVEDSGYEEVYALAKAEHSYWRKLWHRWDCVRHSGVWDVV